ncbi:MAG: methyltransferase domain-containing protein [Marinovum algicola]|uniref:methyltransferase domain-containing protein n=1 Tax=Marinovum algicola TaxID=42444 RepID=UPI0032EBE666
MTDPFQNVDAAGPEFIKIFADTMEIRQSDPTMEALVAGYLSRLDFAKDSLTVEIGAGAGAVTRRIAKHAAPAQVIGYEPSAGFVKEARARAPNFDNLRFEQADGATLPVADNSVDNAILHTVLTHVVAPETLLAEAARALRTGGWLVVADVDFSKAALASAANDPLDCCAKEFVRTYVTDPHLVGRLRGLIADAGLRLDHFDVQSRVIITEAQMLPWVEITTRDMVTRGLIGQGLADALIAEHAQRAADRRLYGYQAIATAIAQKI